MKPVILLVGPVVMLGLVIFAILVLTEAVRRHELNIAGSKSGTQAVSAVAGAAFVGGFMALLLHAIE